MSLPETPLGPPKRREGEPTFDEPWQAQVLGMADELVTSGVIAADAWAARLGAAIRESAEAGAADDANTYYGAVLDALEGLLAQAGAASLTEVDRRERQWRRAYLKTPHGKPVELVAARQSKSS